MDGTLAGLLLASQSALNLIAPDQGQQVSSVSTNIFSTLGNNVHCERGIGGSPPNPLKLKMPLPLEGTSDVANRGMQHEIGQT